IPSILFSLRLPELVMVLTICASSPVVPASGALLPLRDLTALLRCILTGVFSYASRTSLLEGALRLGDIFRRGCCLEGDSMRLIGEIPRFSIRSDDALLILLRLLNDVC